MPLINDSRIFCHNVALLRTRRGLSLREMARILHIGVPTLMKIEAGEIPPSLDCEVLLRLASYFGLKPGELFRPLEEDEPQER